MVAVYITADAALRVARQGKSNEGITNVTATDDADFGVIPLEEEQSHQTKRYIVDDYKTSMNEHTMESRVDQ